MNAFCLLCIVIFLLATASTTLYAQASDTILPNPKAVLLRKIWMVQGETTGPNVYTRVGQSAGELPDVNNDGLSDFAVQYGKTGQWRLYLGKVGAPDTIPFWIYDSSSSELGRPVIGDFFGNGRPLIGISDDTCRFTTSTICYYRLRLFQPQEDGNIPDTALLNLRTTVQPCVDVATGDLDNDKADELVLTYYCYKPEIWLYQGGVGFQVGTPTHVIHDEEELRVGTEYKIQILDIDGDIKNDLVASGHYLNGPKLKIWYGREGSPWNWTSTPDRVISLSSDFAIGTKLVYGDYDGDSNLDLAGNVHLGDSAGIYLYLSTSGKSFRTRTFTRDDADKVMLSSIYYVRDAVGPMNDPTHRFDMLPAIGIDPALLTFSGSRFGPDLKNEAWYSEAIQPNIFYKMHPLEDCNGDGWSDVLVNDPDWWGFDQGIAVILAGGPYIPHDDPTVAVQDLPAEGKPNAISIWPNPVRDVLNIAWHGRLKHSPARLTIHDLAGKLVASGVADPSVGAMRWNASGVASGTYLLTVYDGEGRVIASTRCIKQE